MQKPIVFILDANSTIIDENIFCDENGKRFIKYNPNDFYALDKIKQLIKIEFCAKTDVTKNILNSHGYSLNVVENKLEWINSHYPAEDYFRIFMSDSVSDYPVMKSVNYKICSCRGHWMIKDVVNFAGYYSGGDKAISEALMRIYQIFFHKNNDQMIKFFTE